MKKSIAALALAGSIALIGAVPAMAATPYPAPPAGGTVSDGTVAPGETFTFSGSGFLAGESITITVTLTRSPQAIGGGLSGGASMAVPAKINLPLAPQSFGTTADARGNFAFPISISEAGTYSVAAVGNTSGKTAGPVTVTVSGAAVGAGLANTGNSTALANTGADSSLLLWSLVGGGALAAGITSVVVVRRRATADAAV